MPAAWPQSPVGEELSEEELMEYLRNGINALSLYSQDNVLTRECPELILPKCSFADESGIGYQLTKVQEAFNAI